MHSAVAHLDRDEQTFTIAAQGLADSNFLRFEARVDGLLPPIGGDALAKVTHLVEEAHPHERQPDVAGLFTMVARQHS